ncbi:MAG TPA: YqjK family protein [Burkholderiales bacterium]|nr:YqjK family protein [Burkholderiales bacterium]
MTREHLIALRERRAELVARADTEREAIAAMLARTDAATRWLEAGAGAIAELRRHPSWIAGSLALLFVLRPKRVLKWLASGWSLWRVYRGARAWLFRAAPAAARRARSP